jgi:hypothetical protein
MKESLNACCKTKYGVGAFDLGIALVGTDKGAQVYYKEEVDDNPEIGSEVDVTSNVEMEAMECKKKGFTLTPELWLMKLVLGPIDPAYDGFD